MKIKNNSINEFNAGHIRIANGNYDQILERLNIEVSSSPAFVDVFVTFLP
ncbi:hypothetical protein ABEV54_08790 [Peribacillus psychrosaccharolyticus]